MTKVIDLKDITTVIDGKKIIMTMVGQTSVSSNKKISIGRYDELGNRMAHMLFNRERPSKDDIWMVTPEHDFTEMIGNLGLEINGYRVFEWKSTWIIALRFRSDVNTITIKGTSEFEE